MSKGTLLASLIIAGTALAASRAGAGTLVKDFGGADVLFLDGAVIVEKEPGFQVTINSGQMVDTKAPNTYGEIVTQGGINKGKRMLKVGLLTPLFEYRGKSDPDKEILSVDVNGKSVPVHLLTGGEIAEAIAAGLSSFGGDKLFKTQFSADAPILYVPPVGVAPGATIVFKYEMKPRCCIKLHKRN